MAKATLTEAAMINKLIEVSLQYRLLVIVAFAVVVALGVRAFVLVPVDAFPDVTPNQVNVYTESPGLAAEDVEQLLTAPIETSMAGLPGRRAWVRVPPPLTSRGPSFGSIGSELVPT